MDKPKILLIWLLAAAVIMMFAISGTSQQSSSDDPPYDESEYGPEAPIIWTTPVQARFSHYSHTSIGFSCEDCHDGLFEMYTGAATEAGDFTMAAFAEGKYCGTCHDGGMAFSTATQCGSCHDAPAEPIIFTYPVKAVLFDHDIHVDRGQISCESCHKEVFTMKKGAVEEEERRNIDTEQGKREYLEKIHARYCGTCHDADHAFGYLTRCTVCHIGVKAYQELQKNAGGSTND